MSRFQFRLEKVWRHRQNLVDKNSVEVAKADRRVARLARQIVELDGTIAGHQRGMAPGDGQQLKASELITGAAWRDHLQALRSDLENRLETATRDLARHRSRLNDSWRDLEVLSRLKDRQKADWTAARDKRERKEEDEAAQLGRSRPGRAKISH